MQYSCIKHGDIGSQKGTTKVVIKRTSCELVQAYTDKWVRNLSSTPEGLQQVKKNPRYASFNNNNLFSPMTKTEVEASFCLSLFQNLEFGPE